MSQAKRAQVDYPVLDCVASRWSPYVFEPRGVELEKLRSCLEAARWAASSYNEQPWSFLVARRENLVEFRRMLDCLVEANQAWAADASVLLVTIVARSFARNGSPNRVAQHDLGLAVGNLSCQATALGLAVHQMAGVNLSKVRQEYAIPETHDPVTAIAVGYARPIASPADHPLAERDITPRSRKPLRDLVFAGTWGQPAPELK